MTEKSERVKLYLDESTKSHIVEMVEDELIKKQMRTIVEMENSVIVYMLKNNKTDVHVQVIFARQPWLEDDCRLCFVVFTGRLLVKQGTETNPITFVQNLLDFKDRFQFLQQQQQNL